MCAKLPKTLPLITVGFVLVSLLLCHNLPCLAQKSITVEAEYNLQNGLPSLHVTSLAQDHQGYLWIGTTAGLLRFDGHDFQELHEGYVESIYVSEAGDRWIGTRNGMWKYDPQKNGLVRPTVLDDSSAILHNATINVILEDAEQNLWVATEQSGILTYETTTDHLQQFVADSVANISLQDQSIRTMLFDDQGLLLIGTGNPWLPEQAGALLMFNPKELSISKLADRSMQHYGVDKVTTICRDSDLRIWVGTCSGLFQYDPESDTLYHMNQNDEGIFAPPGVTGLYGSCPNVNVIHQDRVGNMWIGVCGGGLHRFDRNETTNSYRHSCVDCDQSRHAFTWSFLEDVDGLFWTGELPGGLKKLRVQEPDILHVHRNSPNSILPSDLIRNIYYQDSRDKIWISTLHGELHVVDRDLGHFDQINSDKAVTYQIAENADGQLYAVTSKGISYIDIEEGIMIPISWANEVLQRLSKPIESIYFDRNGIAWVGTCSEGVFAIDLTAKMVRTYDLKHDNPDECNRVLCFLEDRQGGFWVGTSDQGLYKYAEDLDSFELTWEESIICMVANDKDQLWIGTEGNGLAIFDYRVNSVEYYQEEDGISNDFITDLALSEKGELWISTQAGLSRLTSARTIEKFGIENGFPFDSFNERCMMLHPDGRLLLGGNEGLIIFDPKKYMPKSAPIINLEYLSTTDTLYSIGGGARSQEFSLEHFENNIEIGYVGIYSADPTSTQYRYRLIPHDTTWIYSGSERVARFTNLNAGEYQFEVTASSSTGNFIVQPAILSFKVNPPWWRTWPAVLLWIVSCLAVLIAIYRLMLKQKLAMAEVQRLKELNEIKTTMHTNITHEFRTPITVILGMVEMLRHHSNHSESDLSHLSLIERNAKQLLGLINSVLDLAKLNRGKMPVQYIQYDIVSFMGYLIEPFIQIAKKKNIKVTYYSELDKLVMDFDPEKLTSIVSNLTSNAIKFSASGAQVIIHLSQDTTGEENNLHIKVRNTSTTISPDHSKRIFDRFYQIGNEGTDPGTGIGLTLSRDLAMLMDGTLKLSKSSKESTEFSLMLPIRQTARIVEAIDLKMPEILEETTPIIEPLDPSSALPRVFLIEDNQDIIYYLQNTLSTFYTCEFATSGQEGLKKCQAEVPDLIVLDLMLPDMDGLEICQKLKEDIRTDHIPVVMLTARATPTDRMAGLTRGADAYIVKPFSSAELLTRIEQLILLRRKLLIKFSKENLNHFLKTSPNDPRSRFISKATRIVLDHLDEASFNVTLLAHKIGMSKSQLYRKLKATTGKSTAVFIRSIRLMKAREYLLKDDRSVSEVAYHVGFKDPFWFSRAYREEFGYPPSETRSQQEISDIGV